jgi:large subunit ribosomal protein L7Ae
MPQDGSTLRRRLGTVVHKKTAAVLAIQEVKSEDQRGLAMLVSAAKANLYVFSLLQRIERQGLILCYSSDKYDEQRRQWGGGIRGNKSTAMLRKRAKAAGQNPTAAHLGKL